MKVKAATSLIWQKQLLVFCKEINAYFLPAHYYVYSLSGCAQSVHIHYDQIGSSLTAYQAETSHYVLKGLLSQNMDIWTPSPVILMHCQQQHVVQEQTDPLE